MQFLIAKNWDEAASRYTSTWEACDLLSHKLGRIPKSGTGVISSLKKDTSDIFFRGLPSSILLNCSSQEKEYWVVSNHPAMLPRPSHTPPNGCVPLIRCGSFGAGMSLLFEACRVFFENRLWRKTWDLRFLGPFSLAWLCFNPMVVGWLSMVGGVTF